MVLTKMIKKSLLLKKFSKILISSDLSFLALISLKTCKSTKTLKKIEKCFPVSSFHSSTPMDEGTPKMSGPKYQKNYL